MVEYVRLCFREFVQNSGITERLKILFPAKIPINCHTNVFSGSDSAGATATFRATLNDQAGGAEPSMDPLDLEGITIHATPDIFDSRSDLFRLKESLAYAFTTIATRHSTTPTDLSRDRAINHGIADQIYFSNKHSLIDPASLVTHDATTCGLSTGDHVSLRYIDPVAEYIFGIATQSACRNIPREKLWVLCEHLGLLYESTGQRPLTTEVDDAIRQFCGQDADNILSHPAFRKTEEGVQMIVYTTRDRSKAILCQFEIGPPHPFGTGAPDTFREIEMRSHYTSWRFSLLNSRSDILHTAPLFESVGGRPVKTERAIIEFDIATHDKAYGKLNRFAGKFSAYRVTGGNHAADVARHRTEERRKKRK